MHLGWQITWLFLSSVYSPDSSCSWGNKKLFHCTFASLVDFTSELEAFIYQTLRFHIRSFHIDFCKASYKLKNSPWWEWISRVTQPNCIMCIFALTTALIIAPCFLLYNMNNSAEKVLISVLKKLLKSPFRRRHLTHLFSAPWKIRKKGLLTRNCACNCKRKKWTFILANLPIFKLICNIGVILLTAVSTRIRLGHHIPGF